MKYYECPNCGAALDPGERCDCQDKREDAPDAAETPSSKRCAASSVADPPPNVNRCLRLKDVRLQSGTMAKDAALVVRKIFPKFNRQLLAQCENWDKYGVIIHPDGLDALCDAYRVMQHIKASPEVPSPATDNGDSGLSQKDRILRHLKDYGSITSLEAMQEYGIMRLASRISELKNMGYTIVSVSEAGKNRYGEKTSYARYLLKEEPHEPV